MYPAPLLIRILTLASVFTLACNMQIHAEDKEDKVLLTPELFDYDYELAYYKKTNMLYVKMERMARYGRSILTISPKDLDLKKADIEDITGGGRRGSTYLSIPLKPNKQVLVHYWDSNPDEEEVKSPESIGYQNSVLICCSSSDAAKKLLGILAKLAK
ncbi:hypothetical protein HW115_10110 [Verrucomicrobiaceae bacterium N1E253]|uniref:Uncharacterized protein n=1 Tax=Oceaniferula marina TaxID=2748318 RepID=A0A851GLL0_9BACT|nr:hypothetical protein [Oceaniferula marina]NWK55967.1 hypothetical protein [Oceaniferula marina]